MESPRESYMVASMLLCNSSKIRLILKPKVRKRSLNRVHFWVNYIRESRESNLKIARFWWGRTVHDLTACTTWRLLLIDSAVWGCWGKNCPAFANTELSLNPSIKAQPKSRAISVGVNLGFVQYIVISISCSWTYSDGLRYVCS